MLGGVMAAAISFHQRADHVETGVQMIKAVSAPRNMPTSLTVTARYLRGTVLVHHNYRVFTQEGHRL